MKCARGGGWVVCVVGLGLGWGGVGGGWVGWMVGGGVGKYGCRWVGVGGQYVHS